MRNAGWELTKRTQPGLRHVDASRRLLIPVGRLTGSRDDSVVVPSTDFTRSPPNDGAKKKRKRETVVDSPARALSAQVCRVGEPS